jgi:hypothetical protein
MAWATKKKPAERINHLEREEWRGTSSNLQSALERRVRIWRSIASMKGALVGKGGSGKTTLASLGSDVFSCSTGSSSMVTDRMSEDGKESHCMSLTVPATLIEQAEAGDMRLDDFLQCIKESLPYACVYG